SIELAVDIEPRLESPSDAVASVLVSFCIIGILLCVFYLVGVCHYMHRAVIKASSFPFCIMTAVSSMLFCLDALLINVQQMTGSAVDSCIAQQFLFGAGFSW